ncbi:aldose 1-epimerase family protein [Pelagicoccus sp. SDUM812005]|uniref:aldose 1-epimerase family protein n=1 Tax=Pelagicoccus sp. SDUM812005 TaxID=3041257 RepID=UPI00280D1FA3|nr:aldose 1-epimerase family protein [Pelagicoccus sp. SDUM812005]MDQ8182546.1 aldose 1-epimerase family protein [Pelagicoccus sp. SDUM812005]
MAFSQSLIHPESAESMPSLQIDGRRVPVGTKHAWSVRTRTLRGGTQEGVDVVEIDTGKLAFAILPTRGMGIWKGQAGKIQLGWDSPVKRPVHPAFVQGLENGGLGWLKGFNEWIVRCGLSSMGAPGMDTLVDNNGNAMEAFLPLHGNIANIPAHTVSLEVTEEAIVLRGEVDETMMFGPALRLQTEIRAAFGSSSLTIVDTVTNLGDKPTEHELLYHVNYGSSLLEKGSRFVAPFKQVAPRDPRAAEGIAEFDRYAAPQAGFVEQAYFFELAGKRGSRQTLAMLKNAKGDQASLLRYSLKDFPCFTLWKNTAGAKDGYVTGLEPATAYPNPRRFEREKGRVLTLAGGESRTTTLVVENLDTKKAIRAVEAEIKALQKGAKGTVHSQAIAKFSDL